MKPDEPYSPEELAAWRDRVAGPWESEWVPERRFLATIKDRDRIVRTLTDALVQVSGLADSALGLVHRGEAFAERPVLNRVLDTAVERWRQHGNGVPLHEWLGLSLDECNRWAADARALPGDDRTPLGLSAGRRRGGGR